MKTFAQNFDYSNHELMASNPYQLGTLMDLAHLENKQLIDGYKNMANSETSASRSDKTNSYNDD